MAAAPRAPLEVVLRLGVGTAAAGGCSGSVLERGDAEQIVRAQGCTHLVELRIKRAAAPLEGREHAV